MALQFSYDSEFGITFDTAYAKVTNFLGSKTDISFFVSIHKDKQAKEEVKTPLSVESYTIPTTETFSISDFYLYLKTLPEYANAIDI